MLGKHAHAVECIFHESLLYTGCINKEALLTRDFVPLPILYLPTAKAKVCESACRNLRILQGADSCFGVSNIKNSFFTNMMKVFL